LAAIDRMATPAFLIPGALAGVIYPAAPECNLSACFNFSALKYSVLN
jgi:hypothetical protein